MFSARIVWLLSTIVGHVRHFSRAIFFNLTLIFASSIASGENGSVQLNSPSVKYGLPAGSACVVTQI